MPLFWNSSKIIQTQDLNEKFISQKHIHLFACLVLKVHMLCVLQIIYQISAFWNHKYKKKKKHCYYLILFLHLKALFIILFSTFKKLSILLSPITPSAPSISFLFFFPLLLSLITALFCHFLSSSPCKFFPPLLCNGKFLFYW